MTERECLRACALFEGLDEKSLHAALAFFDARRASYRKGDAVIRIGGRLERFGLVLRGEVQVLQDDIDGHHIIMAQNSAGETFGESLCFLQIPEAPVYAFAVNNAQVLWLSCESLRKPCSDALSFELYTRFTSMLARRTLNMNSRIQVLSRHSLREKILTFLSQCARKAGTRCVEIPFSRTDWAVYLGVNRSALARELGRMRDEGLIAFEKRRFVLCHPEAQADRPE